MKTEILKNLTEKIKILKQQIDMDNSYRVPVECQYLSPEAMERIRREDSSYKKNILLKLELSSLLSSVNDVNLLNDIYRWIIHSWGGIRRFQSFERIPLFMKELTEGNLTDTRSLSSLSKVASFVDTGKYFIYDSRVSFVLNWLLYESGERDSFFQVLLGRSEKTRVNMNMLCNMIEENGGEFMSGSESYIEYCNLIKCLYKSIWGEGGTTPFELEMLLFQSRDIVIEEMERKNIQQ